MADEEHLKILRQGVEVWNRWRKDNPKIKPDLSKTTLVALDLEGVNLAFADLTDLLISNSNLRNAVLRHAVMVHTTVFNVQLRGADLFGADIGIADISRGSLEKAVLKNTEIRVTKFHDVNLKNTVFENADMYENSFSNVDLSLAKGLELVIHSAPSTIGIDTLYKSAGKIPEVFLRGCGVPDDFITFIPSHFGIQQAIQFYSCFISYSTKDEEFARRLYSRMRDEKLRVWFAPEDVKGGEKLQEQIERAIQLHDRLLIILSEESMASEWVKREIRNARRAEVKENRRKLFPIRLVDYKAIENWKGFDGDGGEDLAFELGKYYIPDFSNWKNHDSFEKEFAKLLRDLRAEEAKQAEKRAS